MHLVQEDRIVSVKTLYANILTRVAKWAAGVEGGRGMSVGWKGRCASVLWHGVIDRHLATPSCSRRVDKGVGKGVETLSRFHGSVTGSRSPCHPFASWCTRYMHHPAIRLYFPDSCVCSCRCREDQICKLCAKEPLLQPCSLSIPRFGR